MRKRNPRGAWSGFGWALFHLSLLGGQGEAAETASLPFRAQHVLRGRP